MPKTARVLIEIDGKQVPLDIHKEWRNSVRIAVAKKSLILRVPKVVPDILLQKHIDWAKDWLIKQLKKKPNLLDQYETVAYHDGDLVHITDKTYNLAIIEEDRKTNSGNLRGENFLVMKINRNLSHEQKQSVIVKLIRRLIAKDQTPDVAQRIKEINDTYFQKPIKNVKLKYNTSNWGSCSSDSNINISTRLLLAPRDVQDYVFIHELAHLEELNHSPRFWKIVRDVMPDYKDKEKWLTKNGHLCRI